MADKYLIALEIDRVRLGDTFELPPLHSTAMHWFTSRCSTEDVVRTVTASMSVEEPVLLIGGAPALFGLKKDVPVNTIKNREPSVQLHKRLFERLTEIGAVHEAPYWTLEGYNPHVSVVNGVRFHEGEEHLATHAYIVSAFTDDARMKSVIARMELMGE